jgi:uncharacterized protein (TIGR00297 family)
MKKSLIPDFSCSLLIVNQTHEPARGNQEATMQAGIVANSFLRSSEKLGWSVAQENLAWQSKLVLLAVLPFAGTNVLLDCAGWLGGPQPVNVWTIGVSVLLGLVTWKTRAATAAGAATGTIITASLMFSTLSFPYAPWHTALLPVVAVALLAFAATHAGRAKKERLGTAESRRGRSAAQVAANLGPAALAAIGSFQWWLLDLRWPHSITQAGVPLLVLAIAAMAEAAADTVSSEIGQLFGRRPRMITTFRAAEPGTDGAVSLPGTLAGALAAGIVAGAGTWALGGNRNFFAVSCAGAVFGLFFDSVLGATLERWGWLNNDAVNFLSTASAAGFALVLVVFAAHSGAG